jgi:hypothetical protein
MLGCSELERDDPSTVQCGLGETALPDEAASSSSAPIQNLKFNIDSVPPHGTSPLRARCFAPVQNGYKPSPLFKISILFRVYSRLKNLLLPISAFSFLFSTFLHSLPQ